MKKEPWATSTPTHTRSKRKTWTAIAAALVALTAMSFMFAPSASAQQSLVACGLAAYVDTHNGRVWAAGYTTPSSCRPVGSLSGQLERDGVLVARGERSCNGSPNCTVASNSVGLTSARHLWCARVAFYGGSQDPVMIKYSCRYIPA